LDETSPPLFVELDAALPPIKTLIMTFISHF
jgi:hypothetical protein